MEWSGGRDSFTFSLRSGGALTFSGSGKAEVRQGPSTVVQPRRALRSAGRDERPQLADAARRTQPRLKVLFVTGYAEGATVGDGRLDGGMQVMTKPLMVGALAARVREMIDA